MEIDLLDSVVNEPKTDTGNNSYEYLSIKMKNFDVAQSTAYLIDCVITMKPNKAVEELDKSPFIKKKFLTHITKQDLIYLSNIIQKKVRYYTVIKKGLWGIGIELDEENEEFIVLNADKYACEALDHTIHTMQEIFNTKIKCKCISAPKFASVYCIPGGSCIKTPSGNGCGILGAWLKRKYNRSISHVGITNNHVAVEFNKYKKGTVLYNKSKCPIGHVDGFVPLKKYRLKKGDVNFVDLAWIKPKNNKIIDLSLGCNAKLPIGEFDLSRYLYTGEEISLCKENSQKGIVTAFYKTFYIQNILTKYKFLNVIQINIGGPGDSGALILNNHHEIGGIFFAFTDMANVKYGYVNKWEYVKSLSGMDFDYK